MSGQYSQDRILRTERDRFRSDAAYYRRALKMVAEGVPPPLEVAADPLQFYPEMCRRLVARLEIAKRALVGEPLEPPPNMVPDKEERELAEGHFAQDQVELKAELEQSK